MKYENLVNGLKNIYISFLIYCLIFIKVKYWSEDDFNNIEV